MEEVIRVEHENEKPRRPVSSLPTTPGTSQARGAAHPRRDLGAAEERVKNLASYWRATPVRRCPPRTERGGAVSGSVQRSFPSRAGELPQNRLVRTRQRHRSLNLMKRAEGEAREDVLVAVETDR